MSETKQTIRLDLRQSFAEMAETVLREWTQDNATPSQVVSVSNVVSTLVVSIWKPLHLTLNTLGIPAEQQGKIWNAVVLAAWNTVITDFFRGRFQVVEETKS